MRLGVEQALPANRMRPRAQPADADHFVIQFVKARKLIEQLGDARAGVRALQQRAVRFGLHALIDGLRRGLLIDAFYSAGLNFAPLSPNATEQLAKMLGPGSIVGNPLDAGFAAVVDPTVYIKSVQLMIEDPDRWAPGYVEAGASSRKSRPRPARARRRSAICQFLSGRTRSSSGIRSSARSVMRSRSR